MVMVFVICFLILRRLENLSNLKKAMCQKSAVSTPHAKRKFR